MTRVTELTPLLKRLRLGTMAATLPERIALARREQLDYASFLEIILSDEVNRRDHRRIELRLQGAGFEETCRLEDFDWSASISLDRRLLDAFFSLEFLDKHEHVLLVGPAGVGKSFLAQALGYSADLYELILNRHRTSSFVITSDRAVDEWLSLFDDPILGNSALDRLANASYQIVIEGASYRERLSPHRALSGVQGGDLPANNNLILAQHYAPRVDGCPWKWPVAVLRFRQWLTGQRKCPSMKDVTLNQREQARLHVLNSVLEYQVPIAQAAELLRVSQRHARRLLAGYRQQGAAALAHGNRGRRPHNAIPAAEAAAVVELATQRYEGANHTHFTELLREREGIDLSRPTVRRILTRAGIGSPRSRRSPQHRFRRQRMPQAGMLVQLDGSHHAWLEDRGPKFVLLLAVDDATGAVVNAVFRTGEDTRGYFMLLEGLIEDWGIPLALYSDRHAVFKHNARKPETAAEATQFTRSLQELGIRQIFARSPQAKGRVERAAGTFQDRLVTELRLAGARTIDQATAVLEDFLPRFNARFAVKPEHPEAAYRPVDPDLCLSEIRCFKDTRKAGRDNTVKYHWRVLQTAARWGTSQLCWPTGRRVGTARRGTHHPVPGSHCGHAGATAADGRAVGVGHRLVSRTRTQTHRQQRG